MPQTQEETPAIEPAAGPGVPSVNPETHEIADSESSKDAWIDPIFEEQNNNPLPDEIVQAGDDEAEKVSNAETPAEGAPPSAEQLAELVAQGSTAGEPAAAPDGAKADKPAPPAEKAKKEPAEGGGEGGDASSEAAVGGDAGSVSADSEDDDKQTRINRRNRRERERAAEIRDLRGQNTALQDRLSALEKARTAGEAPAGDAAEPELSADPPTLEDHDFDTEKWATAMGEWTKKTVAQSEHKAEEARRQEGAKEAATRHDEAVEAFEKRQDAARKAHEDYDEVVYDFSLVIPPGAAQVIWSSEHGPELAYHLATHQDEAKAMTGLSELDLGRAIAKIEMTLGAAEAPAAAEAPPPDPDNAEAVAAEQAPANPPARQGKPAPSPTKAPPPVPTIGGSGAAARPNVEKMNMDEYAAGRRSGKIR